MAIKNLKSAILILLLIAVNTYAKSNVKIQNWDTNHGSRVLFFEAHELPMLDVNVIFYAGSIYDGKKYGLANFTNSMLDTGTKTLSVDQIADKFAEVGAHFHAYANSDQSGVALRCLSEPKVLNSAIAIFTEVLNEPTFPANEFLRTKKQILNFIQLRKQDPSSVANEEFYKKLYGEFPYNHMTIGTTETVTKLTAKNLQDFYKQYYTAKNAIIIIVGDVTKNQAEQIAEQITAKLPMGDGTKKITTKLPKIQAATSHIEFPAMQTNVLIGEVGIARDDPDYFPLFVGNYIIGSAFTSELYLEIREKRGLVYHIGSHVVATQYPGPFMIEFGSSNEKSQEAIQATLKVLKQFWQQGPTEKQLIAAKKSITGQFPLKVANNNGIMRELGMIGFYNLPLDYLDTYVDKINAVTLPQIQAAFSRHFDLDTFLIVTVGKKINSTKGKI